jgi:hypothetical protein
VEVCPLSRRGHVALRPNPYPPHYRAAFASSTFPYPQPQGRALRRAFLEGRLRAYHVPPLRPDGVGSAYPPGVLPSTTGEAKALVPTTVPVGSSLSASFGLFFLTTFISSSPLLALPSDPSPRTTVMLVVVIAPRGLITVLADEVTVSQELHTAGLLPPHVLVGYWR